MNGINGGSNGTPASNMMVGTAAQQSNSKASTVELAIEYIKNLQRDLKGAQEELAALKGERGEENKEIKQNGDTPLKIAVTST